MPPLPIELLRRLGTLGEVYLVGYSLGGIAALASALVVGDAHFLRECVLLNCCTTFWPPWYSMLLPNDWWAHPPAVSSKITSWVIANDPLCDGKAGDSCRPPQVPGTTRVLPSCVEVDKALDNHSFSHFVASLPRGSE